MLPPLNPHKASQPRTLNMQPRSIEKRLNRVNSDSDYALESLEADLDVDVIRNVICKAAQDEGSFTAKHQRCEASPATIHRPRRSNLPLTRLCKLYRPHEFKSALGAEHASSCPLEWPLRQLPPSPVPPPDRSHKEGALAS